VAVAEAIYDLLEGSPVARGRQRLVHVHGVGVVSGSATRGKLELKLEQGRVLRESYFAFVR
jgi:hypothetical protein